MTSAAPHCPICKSPHVKLKSAQDSYVVACVRCGIYRVTGTADAMLASQRLTDREVANASGWLREHPDVVVSSGEVAALPSISRPTVMERAEKLLRELERRTPALGVAVKLDFATTHGTQDWLGIAWAVNHAELHYLLAEVLGQQDLVTFTSLSIGTAEVNSAKILPAGYSRLDAIRQTLSQSQLGFCAMWFKPELQPLWINAIEPAILEAGYEPKRVDFHPHNNKIDDEIIALIRRSKFIVADATGGRGGVYFEAGFAMGLNKPVFWTCRDSRLHRVHFDTRQYNFVTWDSSDLVGFRGRLRNRIEATIGRGTYVRPAA